MVLKEEVVECGDIKVKVIELSLQKQMELDELKEQNKKTTLEIYKRCLEKPELLDQINSKEEGLKVMQAVNRVNGWVTKKEGDKDFQEQPEEKSGD